MESIAVFRAARSWVSGWLSVAVSLKDTSPICCRFKSICSTNALLAFFSSSSAPTSAIDAELSITRMLSSGCGCSTHVVGTLVGVVVDVGDAGVGVLVARTVGVGDGVGVLVGVLVSVGDGGAVLVALTVSVGDS